MQHCAYIMSSNPPTRRSAPREKIAARLTISITASLLREAEEQATAHGQSLSEFVRAGIEKMIRPEVDPALAGTDQFRAPLLPKIPCGPWREAIEGNRDFVISKEEADELGARIGDVFIQANGSSMVGAGIVDGAIVLVRPYDGRAPMSGDIALVQCQLPDQEPEYTLKRWVRDGRPGVPPHLENGDGEHVPPADGAEVQAVARAIGVVLSRL